ncbi:ankyrin repeat domain-containing protein [Roseimicrobium sp. ORNL1]|uniref:ankyrin repeat domain-containing protein n=1 Tax=Roseimicrobium sp. ORNL1 TaxID=2711231 RepID=UPI0013E18178|nr:ankyrin repeat domain-containing protein [Roseimicrobium sp. ORNL1]QIF02829.1 ankyrin repeat domain-containing protein [Roseimicrobium sp. ORNL1]
MKAEHEIFPIIRREPVEVFLEKLKSVAPGVTSRGMSMLHEAIAYGKAQHAELLILHGVDVDAQDKQGQTPLHYAAIHNDLETAKLLVTHKADQLVSDKFGNAPLWYAVFNARGRYELTRLYIEAGGPVSRKNKSGRSPLDFAVQIGDAELQGLLSVG